jgi:hypothetical protein
MDDAQAMIDRLCVMAAMIIEDQIDGALTPAISTVQVRRLARCGSDVAALAEAALVIASRWPSPQSETSITNPESGTNLA